MSNPDFLIYNGHQYIDTGATVDSITMSPEPPIPMYGITIKDSGNIIFKYPLRRTSDGAIGGYNYITHKFYTTEELNNRNTECYWKLRENEIVEVIEI